MTEQNSKNNKKGNGTMAETKESKDNKNTEAAFPTEDSEGRTYGSYVERLEAKDEAGERIRKDERLVAAIHEAVRLGINPNAGQTPADALNRLLEEYNPFADNFDKEKAMKSADLSPVVFPWLDELPVFEKPDDGEPGNYQQGHFYGVFWRREMPKEVRPTRQRTGGTGGSTKQLREALETLEDRVVGLERRLMALDPDSEETAKTEK